MADTVEQVYVWDGNDWVPVVRDETVSNTSELTNDGEDGVNPFITAADIPAVADKKLPIDSVDGTVVLDSPSANAFSLSTGGAEKIKAGTNVILQTEANNAFVVNPTGSAYGSLHTCRANSSAGQAVRPFLTSVHASHSYNVRATDWSYLTIDLLSGDPASPYKLSDYQAIAFNGKVDRFSGFTVGGFDPVFMEATQAYGAYINVNAALDGREFFSVYCDGTAPSHFHGGIQTTRIAGSFFPGTDASIELGAELLTSNHTPTQPNSIATKQYADTKAYNDTQIKADLAAESSARQAADNALQADIDNKIWVGTTAAYNALATKNPTTPYCLTD